MNKIITIGREFGSGGRELGRRLAQALHMEYYDKEIISEIAKHTSLSEKYIQEITERQPHPLFPIHIGRSIQYVHNHAFEQSHSIFQEQSRIIREMAEKSDCVIVGRCAEYVLDEYHPFRIFTYAGLESKIQRCKEKGTEQEGYSDKEWERHILSVDKQRSKYYSFYTEKVWGEKANYDLCINTTSFTIKELAQLLSGILTQSN